MLRVLVEQLRPGMKVGRSICDLSGRILLAAGTELKESYIERLKLLGIPSVYLWNEVAPDAVAEDVIDPETRHRLGTEIKQVMTELRKTLTDQGRNRMRRWRLNTDQMRSVVHQMVNEVLINRNALVHLQDIRTHDEYTMCHSVNVCVLSTLMGAALGLDLRSLRDLAQGALLHDIGKVTIPEEILNKTGPLTAEEMEEMRQHAERGFHILRQEAEISLLSAHVAYQHHERWSGGGYPRGLKGEEIHPFARIVSVADVYDAMTADRPYRKGHAPERALRNMHEIIPDWFEPRILNAFIDHIALYPIGSVVELNTGEIGVVIAAARGQSDRPKVRVFKEPDGRRVSQPYDQDLLRNSSLAVVRVLAEPEEAGLAPELTEAGDTVYV